MSGGLRGPEPRGLVRSALAELGALGGPVRCMAWGGAILAPLSLLVLLLPQARLGTIELVLDRTSIPQVTLWVGAGLQTLGLWYLLAVGAFARPWLRWLALSWVMLMQFFGGLVTLLGWVAVLLTVLFGVLTGRGRIRSTGGVLLFAAAITLLFEGALLATGVEGYALYSLTGVQLFSFIFLPMVFLTGIDLARIGPSILRALLRPIGPGGPAGPLFALGLALGAAMLVLAAAGGIGWGAGVVLLAVGLGVLTLRLAGDPTGPREQLLLALSPLVFLSDPGVGRGIIVWAAVGSLVAGLLLIGVSSGRRRFGAAAALLVMFGVWNILRAAPPLLRLAGPWGITPSALAAAVAVVSIGQLLWLRVRGMLSAERARTVITWLLGLTLLTIVWRLLGALQGSLAVTALPVLLVVLALGHRIATAGPLLGQAPGRAPDPARVLLFVGSLLLLAGGIVLGVGATGALGSAELPAAAELYGLVTLGLPVLLIEWLWALRPNRRTEGADGHGNVPARGGPG